MRAHPKTGRTIREEAEFVAQTIESQLANGILTSNEAMIERAILRYAAPRYTKNGTGKVKIPCERCMGSGSKNDAISCGDCGGRGFTERAKDAPDPRVKLFIEWFIGVYHLNRGTTYLPVWWRDGKLVKGLLSKVPIDHLEDCARILLDARTEDRYIQDSDRGISALAYRFNWLNGRRAAFLAKQARAR